MRVQKQTAARTDEVVVLLHGLGRSSLSMKRVEWHLGRLGWQVLNIGYRWRSSPLDRLAHEFLPGVLAKRLPMDVQRVHFVTHSMGGILVRQYLAKSNDSRVGRVVMLAPPNQGSELADALARHPLLRWLVGPNLALLGTDDASIPRRLAPITGEVGVIAADRPLWPWGSPLQWPHDGKVSVASTKLAGMSAHVTVHASHSFMMWRRDVLAAVAHFLETGRFTSTD